MAVHVYSHSLQSQFLGSYAKLLNFNVITVAYKYTDVLQKRYMSDINFDHVKSHGLNRPKVYSFSSWNWYNQQDTQVYVEELHLLNLVEPTVIVLNLFQINCIMHSDHK